MHHLIFWQQLFCILVETSRFMGITQTVVLHQFTWLPKVAENQIMYSIGYAASIWCIYIVARKDFHSLLPLVMLWSEKIPCENNMIKIIIALWPFIIIIAFVRVKIKCYMFLFSCCNTWYVWDFSTLCVLYRFLTAGRKIKAYFVSAACCSSIAILLDKDHNHLASARSTAKRVA